MTKKYIFALLATFLIPVSFAFAATPIFSASGNGDNNNVLVNVYNADGNTGVFLYFKGITDNTTHSQQIGTTNSSGSFTGTVSTNGVGILSNTPVYAMINGYQSNSLTWPYNATVQLSQLTFSQNNVNLSTGQSITITVTGGNGSYYLSSNSNSGVLNTSISGSTVTLYGLATGSTAVRICSGSESICGTVNVSVNTTNNTTFTLNPSNITLTKGQQGTVQLQGGSAPYTISTLTGNSVLYYFTGSMLTVNSTDPGTRTMRVCSSDGVCSTLTININDTGNNGTFTLTPSSINLNVGQSGMIQLSGGTMPYSVYTVQGNSVSSTVNGGTVTFTGVSLGTTSFNVCSSNGTCILLSVPVGTTGNTSSIGFTLPLAISQTENITLSGGNGSYYYLQSAITSPFSAAITGNTLSVRGVTYGTAQVTVCQASGSVCLPLSFNVNQAAPISTGTGGPYIFSNDLWIEMKNSEVKELQSYLIAEKYLDSNVTGYFGLLTLDAVKRFQIANGIPSTGYVGILTRTALNQ